MKRTFIGIMLTVLLTAASWGVRSQSCADYNLTIHGDFESECVYDYKYLATDEYPGVLVACKGNTVTYTALVNNQLAPVSQYIWEVDGDVSHNASGSDCTVTWDNGGTGILVVSIVIPNGDTCTASRLVKLIDKPQVGAETVPNYTVTGDGTKVIYVCSGGSIDFIDASDPGASDIAGYEWWCQSGPVSTTATYHLDNVTSNDSIHHRVYNNCGCYDEEVYHIEVLTGERLTLGCYGTVCGGSKVQYTTATPTSCLQYRWYAEGGVVVDGQGSATPTVQWEFPDGGYGVLGLDGVLCGGLTCPALMSVKVPVISEGLEIEGQRDVCLGERVLFSLPLFGSTEYTWTVTHNGISEEQESKSHELSYVFDEEGTYTVEAEYRCAFLGCGPYQSAVATVTVRPPLGIAGPDGLCPGAACTYSSVPAVPADWTVTDLSDGTSVSGSGTTFSPVLGHAGRYLVTAEATGYCGPATMVVTVRQPPAAPTVSDMDPANRHAACPNDGIMLSGTPPDLRYAFLWEPECSTAAPQQYYGDSVTVQYGSDVCGVRVYTYDRETGCRSDDYYLHSVAALAPAPLGLPRNITVCPGTQLHWGPPEVPDQEADGMLYEWKMGQLTQYCATVVGDHKRSSVDIQVNEVAVGTVFNIFLERRWCNSSRWDTVTVTVASYPVTLAISGPDTVCIGSEATFSASCYPSGGCTGYSWDIARQSHGGNPVSHTFADEGDYVAMVECNPYSYCTNKSYYSTYGKAVHVRHQVMTSVIDYNRTTRVLSLLPPLGAGHTYLWQYNGTSGGGTPVSLGTGATALYCGVGSYSCTVTETATGCSKTLTEWCDSLGDPQTLALTAGDYNWCTRTVTLTAPTPPQFHTVTWSVAGGGYTIETRGTRDHIADVTVHNVGSYTVIARDPHPAAQNRRWRHTFTVPLIPSIGFVPQCTSVKLNNESRYLYGATEMYIRVEMDGATLQTIHFRADQKTYTYTPSMGSGLHTMAFYFTGYRMPGQSLTAVDECLLGSVEIGNNGTTVSIATSNPYDSPGTYTTCDNTPLQLTASLSDGSHIGHSAWTFSDGSSLNTSGASVYHTFMENQNIYQVNVTVTDVHGCQRSNTVQITSASNPIGNGSVGYSGSPICPYGSQYKDVFFIPNYFAVSYRWINDLDWPNNPFPADHSDFYRVLATTVNNCQREAEEFVPFLPCPTARIYARNYNCCVGDDVTLHGALSPDPNLTYSWSITQGNYVQTGTTPDIVFHAPSTGTYNVSLTVTDGSSGCSATDTKVLTVHTMPAAPTIAFVNPHCIGDPPVTLTATGYSGTVFWSNGDTGPAAEYHYPGPLSAWYYDPAIGCPSNTAHKFIAHQPDMDAVLTGCYERCKEMPDSLKVYGLVPAGETIAWEWYRNNSMIANGYGQFAPPLALPLNNMGDYLLDVTYDGPACHTSSPTLAIEEKKLCDCDSISMVCTGMNVSADQNCNLTCKISLLITNESHSTACIDTVWLDEGNHNIALSQMTPARRILGPGGSYTVIAKIKIITVRPSVACFTVTDHCNDCTKEYCFDITPEVPCRQVYTEHNLELMANTALSNSGTCYIEFIQQFSGLLYDCRSNPPTVMDYTVTGGYVTGLMMIDRAVLDRLVEEGGYVDLELLVCDNGQLCWLVYRVTASYVAGLLDMASSDGRDGLQETAPALQPNPATGWVKVTGINGAVEAVTVIDMQGRRMAEHRNMADFDASALAAGSYIVRVDSRAHDGTRRTDYIKLVKK